MFLPLMSPLFFILIPYVLSSRVGYLNELVPTEPHWWKVIWMNHRLQEACQHYRKGCGLRLVLPPRLYRLFSSDPQLPFVLKESLQAALSACKQSNIERDEKLTCTVQSSRPFGSLFKTVNAYDSRDFSFLLSLTTAFAVRSIAEACAEGRLKKCSCDKEYTGSIGGRPNSFFWSECINDKGSHNLPYAIKLSRKLIDYQYQCVVPDRLREVLLHNISVGRTRLTSSVSCRCDDSIDCGRKLCQLRVVDQSSLLDRIRLSLWNSRRIRRSNQIEMNVEKCKRRNRDRKHKNRPAPIWYIEDSNCNLPSFYLGIPE